MWIFASPRETTTNTVPEKTSIQEQTKTSGDTSKQAQVSITVKNPETVAPKLDLHVVEQSSAKPAQNATNLNGAPANAHVDPHVNVQASSVDSVVIIHSDQHVADKGSTDPHVEAPKS